MNGLDWTDAAAVLGELECEVTDWLAAERGFTDHAEKCDL